MTAPGRVRVSPRPAGSPFQVLMDFDGTFVEPNVAIELVAEFARDGARVAKEVDLDLHAGRITLREAWAREVALLPMDRMDEMARYTVDNIPLRSGARELCRFLLGRSLPLAIVSGGLDFYITPLLRREGLDVPVFSDSVDRGGEGGKALLRHPYGHPTCRLCGICKAEVVRTHSLQGPPVVFVGDGSTDRYAAETADVVFARHRLLTYCREQGIPHVPFEDLHPVREHLEAWMEGRTPLPLRGSKGLASSSCPISQELARVRPTGA